MTGDESGEEANEVEKVKDISSSHSERSNSGFSGLLPGFRKLFVILVIVGIGIAFWNFLPTLQAEAPDFEPKDNSTVQEKDNKEEISGGDSGDKTSMPDFDGVKVHLKEGYAEPSRPSISPDEDVMFVNEAGYAVELTFSSRDTSFEIGPGEWKIVDINQLVYYSAEPLGDKGQTIPGSVFVSD